MAKKAAKAAKAVRKPAARKTDKSNKNKEQSKNAGGVIQSKTRPTVKDNEPPLHDEPLTPSQNAPSNTTKWEVPPGQ